MDKSPWLLDIQTAKRAMVRIIFNTWFVMEVSRLGKQRHRLPNIRCKRILAAYLATDVGQKCEAIFTQPTGSARRLGS